MFKKIMLTLDGSELAEKAFPYAIALASRLESSLLLTRVLAGKDKSPGQLEEARLYLQQAYSRLIVTLPQLNIENSNIQTRVVCGNTVNELTNLAHEEEVDLIVLTTRATGNNAQIDTQSVAKSLLRKTGLPVLMVHPEHDANKALSSESIGEGNISVRFAKNPFLRLVVALDGTAEAETALKPATQLAEQLEAPIFLLRVHQPVLEEVIPSGEIPGGVARPVKSRANSRLMLETRHYINAIQNKLTDREFFSPSYVLTGNNIPAEIIKFCHSLPYPVLLIMATHTAKWDGQQSIAEEVMRDSHLPVLMLNSPVHV